MKIAQTIIDRGGDDILSVYENQGNRYEDIRDPFEDDRKTIFKTPLIVSPVLGFKKVRHEG